MSIISFSTSSFSRFFPLFLSFSSQPIENAFIVFKRETVTSLRHFVRLHAVFVASLGIMSACSLHASVGKLCKHFPLANRLLQRRIYANKLCRRAVEWINILACDYVTKHSVTRKAPNQILMQKKWFWKKSGRNSLNLFMNPWQRNFHTVLLKKMHFSDVKEFVRRTLIMRRWNRWKLNTFSFEELFIIVWLLMEHSTSDFEFNINLKRF